MGLRIEETEVSGAERHGRPAESDVLPAENHVPARPTTQKRERVRTMPVRRSRQFLNGSTRNQELFFGGCVALSEDPALSAILFAFSIPCSLMYCPCLVTFQFPAAQ